MDRMDKLIVCETDKGNYAVRPLNWAGIWCDNGKIKECGLNHIAIFHYKEDAEWYAETKNSEEKGLLLKLPCKVGDVVFTTCGTKIETEEVIEIRLRKNDKSEFVYQYLINGGYAYFEEDDIGKDVFFTYEEAEKKRVERFGE